MPSVVNVWRLARIFDSQSCPDSDNDQVKMFLCPRVYDQTHAELMAVQSNQGYLDDVQYEQIFMNEFENDWITMVSGVR